MADRYLELITGPLLRNTPLGEGAFAAQAYKSESACPYPPGSEDHEAWLIGWERARQANPKLTERPPRRMPSMKAIIRHHGLPGRYCVRCSDDGYLERAHIIDRVFGGLDNAANLAPLCDYCHRTQPIFKPGQEGEALRWFRLVPLPHQVSHP